MSEKEQAQALKLLAAWLELTRYAVDVTSPPDPEVVRALRARTEEFMGPPPAESHGQRRS